MSWSNWIYLGVGLALGMGSRWLFVNQERGRGRETLVRTAEADTGGLPAGTPNEPV